MSVEEGGYGNECIYCYLYRIYFGLLFIYVIVYRFCNLVVDCDYVYLNCFYDVYNSILFCEDVFVLEVSFE